MSSNDCPAVSQDNAPSPSAVPASEISDEQQEIADLRRQVLSLNNQLTSFRPTFGYQQLKHDENLIKFYTGLPSHSVFKFLCDILRRFDIVFYEQWSVTTLSLEDQVLLTLMKLRHGFPHLDLATRFNVTTSTVRNVFLTYLHALHEIIYKQFLGHIPPVEHNQSNLPACFAPFPNTRITLDCTEVAIEIPGSMYAQNVTYSSYKGRNTFKGLVGVAPNGTVSFLSELYPGSTSDKEIVRHSKVLEQLQPGDLVLADKGFLIRDLLPPGVTLNIPPFLHAGQFSVPQVLATREIARARIHVERAIQRIKLFGILTLIPVNLRPFASIIFQVCGALTNFQSPIIAVSATQISV